VLTSDPFVSVQVSHDRWFLDRVCDHTLAFDAHGVAEFYEGSISDYDAYKAKMKIHGDIAAAALAAQTATIAAAEA